ncbi:MAG TPA: NUDIX domain-containing protein [Candidatus Nanoarchaeia archaeon]|nr:NUDIX domain-containing protein [Candidatus Nanoarchaeia archaeon]
MIEEQILKLFIENYKLKFNDIEKSLKIRSNKLAYYLKKLKDKGIIVREKNIYSLSKASEFLIPYLSDKKSPLPVILIHIGNKKEAFLYYRTKRPFKNKLGLPGGRLEENESIENGAKRIMFEKFKIKIKNQKIKSISLEHVKTSNKVIYSFLLILISASVKDKINLTNIKINKKRIISSDYKLLKNIQTYNNKLKINTIYSRD